MLHRRSVPLPLQPTDPPLVGKGRISVDVLCHTVMQSPILRSYSREAEGVRFELTRPFGLPVFKTGAINRSATPPANGWPTSNVHRPSSNTECRKLLSVQR